jgi:alpha-galactosidase
LTARLHRERAEHAAHFVRVLERLRRKGFPSKWRVEIRPSETPAVDLPALGEEYFRAGRKTVAAAETPKELHRFRVRTKRFRYALEMFPPVDGAGNLQHLQRILGKISDADSIRELLKTEESHKKNLQAEMRKRMAEFKQYWTETFDAPAQKERWIGDLSRLALLLLALCCLAWAAAVNLTGTWVASMTLPNGEKRDTTFAFLVEGNKLSGYLSTPQGDVPIVDGQVHGDDFTFAIVREQGIEERKIPYQGHVTGAGIVVTMPGFGGGPSREVEANRVSEEAPRLLPPAPPKVLLPKADPLPYNGLAKTPPMGWNSWNKFQRRVSDKIVREIADTMASNGMREAGYVYVNIDDTWEGTRDAQGNIRSNEKFPDMKALADYVHSKGLKLGIYSSPGPKTCAGYEGSYQHEVQDANTYAKWGIDYLKYDWCSASRVYQPASMQSAYALMGKALQGTGRPIVYSLCQYGLLDVGEWGASVGGNLWRTTGDIRDRWASLVDIGFDKQDGREKFAGPGHWNDPDMLEIGNDGMTDTEYRTHISLWALLASPLLAGNDLRTMTPETLQILTNKDVIAVDQDPAGEQAHRVSKSGDGQVWARKLQDGGLAVGLFNLGTDLAKVSAKWVDLGLSGKHAVRDLWTHDDRGMVSGEFGANVPPHGVVLVKIAK